MPKSSAIHPVLRQRAFVIHSPPYVEFEDHFEQCIGVGELSLCMYAPPRQGKTTALMYLARRLEATGRAVVVQTRLTRQQDPNRVDQADFWAMHLQARQLRPLVAAHGRLNEQFVNSLVVAADEKEIDQVVLMYDEAQNLVLQHYAQLKALLDKLIDKGLSPFVLLAAQPAIELRPNALRKAHCLDLVDRFFTRWHRLRGLLPEEFKAFIGNYDVMRWPEPGGPAFTQHFAGPQFAEGWRLANTAEGVQKEFASLAKQFAMPAALELEVKFLSTSLRLILTGIQQANADRKPVDMAKLIAGSVRGSGFIEARTEAGDTEDVKPKKRPGVAA